LLKQRVEVNPRSATIVVSVLQQKEGQGSRHNSIVIPVGMRLKVGLERFKKLFWYIGDEANGGLHRDPLKTGNGISVVGGCGSVAVG